MRRGLLIGAALLLAICATVAGIATSGASFTSASSSTVSASTGGAQTLLHIYSQSSDPDGLTGYCMQPGTSTLDATGMDFTLAANLGREPSSNTNNIRVFTIKAASPLPTGISSITVAVSVTTDPVTGLQPINLIGFDVVGRSSHDSPVTLTAGQKMQCNVRTNVAKPSGTVYHPTVLIDVTYSGFSGTFFRYTVPCTVTAS